MRKERCQCGFWIDDDLGAEPDGLLHQVYLSLHDLLASFAAGDRPELSGGHGQHSRHRQSPAAVSSPRVIACCTIGEALLSPARRSGKSEAPSAWARTTSVSSAF